MKKKADTKAVSLELEEKLQELLDSKANDTENEPTDRHLMPPPSTLPRKKTIRRSRRKSSSDEDEDSSDDSEEDADNEPVKCEFKIDLVNFFSYKYIVYI